MADLKLHGMRLLVDDPDAAFRFYRDAMGLTPRSGEGEQTAVLVDEAGTTVELIAPAQETDARKGNDSPSATDRMTLVFYTASVHDRLQALRECGAEVVSGPTEITPLGFRIARLRDPAGNLIELRQRLI